MIVRYKTIILVLLSLLSAPVLAFSDYYDAGCPNLESGEYTANLPYFSYDRFNNMWIATITAKPVTRTSVFGVMWERTQIISDSDPMHATPLLICQGAVRIPNGQFLPVVAKRIVPYPGPNYKIHCHRNLPIRDLFSCERD